MKRIVITGPTASGKGSLAIELARKLDAEIVSVDSMKVYRGMNVGTAKPSPAIRSEIPFHLLDLVDPWDDFSVGQFLPKALGAIDEIERRGRPVILQGGTALYLKALMDGLFWGPDADWGLRRTLHERAEREGTGALYRQLVEEDPEVALNIHPNDTRRIIRALEVVLRSGRKMSELWKDGTAMRMEPGSYTLHGIHWPRDALYGRIDDRVLRMVARGLFEEARFLMEDPRGLSRCARKCIGYRQIFEGLESGEPVDQIVERIQRETRRFAKQQLTWFRRFPMSWLPPEGATTLAQKVISEVSA